jgi:conjugal transfer pilin signal peptidase TrbI
MSRRRRIAITVGLGLALIAGQRALGLATRYGFGLNQTTSLPNWAFIIDHQNRRPRRGDLVQFIAPDNPYYPRGAAFVKHVWGLPGDLVVRRGRDYAVAGRAAGTAKPFSQTGRATTLGPIGIIPPGHYYVGTASADSLDSRYGEIGWIRADRILGVAAPVL